jgi:Leucine-rich repeat (LRR) protein
VLLTGIGALKRLTLGSLHSLDVLNLDRLTLLKRLKLGSFCHHALKEVPDLARLSSLQELTIGHCDNLTLLRGMGEFVALKQLTLDRLYELKEVPDLARLTALQELTMEECGNLTLLRGIGELVALKQLTLNRLYALKEVLDLARLTALQELTIRCSNLKLLRGICELVALKRLRLGRLYSKEVPDLARLTALQELKIEECGNLTLLRGIGELVALKQLTLDRVYALKGVPNLARLTAQQELTISLCGKLKALPRGIGDLSALKQLSLGCYTLDAREEMPDLARLTALQELTISDCSCLRLPERILQLSALTKLRISHRYTHEHKWDILVIGGALKAWPLPSLAILEFCVGRREVALYAPSLGLPAVAAAWSNAATLDFLRVQQHKVVAFASGLHGRLGAASGVSMLNDQMLTMIANEVLGRSDFRKWLSLWERDCLEECSCDEHYPPSTHSDDNSDKGP